MSTKYIASNWRLPNKAGVDSYLNDNYGLTFDGSSEKINCGDSNVLSFGDGSNDSPFSISLWFNLSTLATPSCLLCKQTSSSNGEYKIYISTAGKIYIELANNGGEANGARGIISNSTISINQWYNIIFTYDGTGGSSAYDGMNLYINNSLDSSTDFSYLSYTAMNNTTADFVIGDLITGSSNTYDFTGKMSELAVFNYALSSTQISTLYGSSSLGSASPLALKPAPVAFYPLGDNSSGNPLTQPNEAVEDASVFNFDTSDFITTKTISEFGITGEFSVSMWLNSTTLNGYATPLWASDNSFVNGFGFYYNSSRFHFFVDHYITYGVAQTGTSTTNVWYHLVGTFSSSGTVKLYINGEATGTPKTGATLDGLNNTLIISRGTAVAGDITNVQLWDKELIDSEVATLYNNGVPLLTGTQPQASSLRAWYKLDQSANWEADSSGAWQIPDAVSTYPQSFDFVPNEIITTPNVFSDIVTGSNKIGICTISYWLKVPGGSLMSFMQLVGSSAAYTAGFRIDSNNKPYYINSSGSRYKRFAALSNPSDWNHWCWVFPSDTSYADLKLYINGVEKSVDFDYSAAPANNAWDGFYINKYQNSSSATFKMSNLQLWSGNLTDPQIAELYNNGTPLTTAIASNNLKAWYKLDNTATFSTNWSVPDASGNGNTGTSSGMTEQNLVNNNVSALNGESSGMTSANLVLTDLTRNLPYDSYSFDFDGVNDYIDFGTSLGNTLGNYSQSLTFSLWAKPVNTTTEVGLLSIKTVGSNDTATSISMFSNILRLTYGAGANKVQVSTTTAGISANNWFHVVGIYTPNEDGKIYVNGNLQTVTSGGTSPSSIDFTGLGLYVGTYYNLTFNFNGPISNVSIFNKELTSTEVMKLYSNGMPQDLSTFTPAPIAWWTLGSNSFFNGSNFICKDLIGSNDGTSANAGVNALQGNTPRSEANGTGTNNAIPDNLVGTTKYSSNNSWSINMSESARVADTP